MTNEDMPYGGGFIDRASDRRMDCEWIAARLAEPGTGLLPVWRNRNLFREGPSGIAEPIVLDGAAGAQLRPLARQAVFLGFKDGNAVFALDLPGDREPPPGALPAASGWADLRSVGPSLDQGEAELLAYARGMLHWHRTHRYCGRCGATTEPQQGGHVRVCTDADCRRQLHPRTDPAVIMLVDRPASESGPAQCLLASHHRLPGVFTTLAGFVEPAETLEDTVVREVREEVGLELAEVRYFGSQPWPFPGQLMVGYRARAATTDIRIDPEELLEARWFTADELREAGEWGDEQAALQLPRRDSIARRLIASWLADVREA